LIRRYLFIAVLATLTAGSVAADDLTDARIPIPTQLFYYRPAATVLGSEAIWNNPAALGRRGAAGFQVMGEYFNGDYVKSYGSAVYRDRIATAFRHIDNPGDDNYDEWVAGTGMAIGTSMNVGVSYRYFRDGPGLYDNRHFWTIGLLKRSGGKLSLGAVFSNLNRGKVNGERTAAEQRYSVGYRPMGNNITLAADMFLSTRNSLRDAEFVYQAEVVPTDGLYLNVSVDSDRNFQIGFRSNLLQYFMGSQSVFNRHGHRGRTTVFAGAVNQRQPSLVPEPHRRLALTVSGRPQENPPRPVLGRQRAPFVSLLTTIYQAAQDPAVAEIVVNLDGLSMGFGQAQEFRNALGAFRRAGKRVICHLQSPNNIGYYVASVADSILIPPVCQVNLVGLRAELTFWAGTLDQIGVDIDLLRIGDHKTAAESYTRRESSDENREQLGRILDDLFAQFVEGIADGRGWSTDSVRNLIDRGPFTSRDALEYGLVDGLSYRDEMGSPFLSRMPQVTFSQYVEDSILLDEWQSLPAVAVVVAEGEITEDRGGATPWSRAGGVTPSGMARALAHAGSDPDVRGIVLRINSPGGWALAGSRILHDVEKAAKRKPTAISMANVAASGGYYIAAPARRMFANPATVTGSIGIYGGKADFSELHRKLNLGKELYTRGRYAGMLTTTRPFTEDERAKYFSQLQAFYDHFVDLVATSRSLSIDSVDQLGRGRVWTGREAQAVGLVDDLGGLRQALDYVAAQAGLRSYRVKVLPEKRPWFIMPRLPLIGPLTSIFASDENGGDVISTVEALLDDETLLARMPYDIVIE